MMTVALVPEMAHSVFRPLAKRLDSSPTEQNFSAADMQELLSGCGIGAAVLDKLTDIFRGVLGRGLETRKLNFLHKEFLDVIELALQVYFKVHQFTERSGLPEAEKCLSLKVLDEIIAKAHAIRQELKSLQSWFERPKPTVDISIFAGRSEVTNPIGYERIEEIEGRNNATGDF